MTDRNPAPAGEMCEWWAMCANEAVWLRDHPFVGDVPICERCDAKVRELEQTR